MRLLRHLLAAALVLLPAAALSQGQVSAPRVTTRPSNDNSTFAASTAYVDLAVQAVQSALSSRAPLNSPNFTGTAQAQGLRLLPVAGQNLGVILNQTFSGSTTNVLSGNYLSLVDTAIAAPQATTIFWNMDYGVSGVSGHRTMLQTMMHFDGADDGRTTTPYYVNHAPTVSVTAGDGGTVDGTTKKPTYATGRGAFFALNPIVKATNSPNLQELQVQENNVSCDATCTVAYKSSLAIVPLSSDKTPGSVVDDLITLSAQPNAVGSRVLINVSSSHGAMPTNSGSTLFRTDAATISTGFDLSALTFTGNAWSSPGMAIDGSGNVNLQQLKSVQFDLGQGINPGTHGARLIGSGTFVFFDNWDGPFAFRAPVQFRGKVTETTSTTPTSSTMTCSVGDHGWDANYEYRCTATNNWKRAALSAF